MTKINFRLKRLILVINNQIKNCLSALISLFIFKNHTYKHYIKKSVTRRSYLCNEICSSLSNLLVQCTVYFIRIGNLSPSIGKQLTVISGLVQLRNGGKYGDQVLLSVMLALNNNVSSHVNAIFVIISLSRHPIVWSINA